MENTFCSHCGSYAEQSYAMKKQLKFRQKTISLCRGCFFAYRARYEVQGFEMIAEDVIMSKQ